jgi:hypothetical protein
MISILLVEEKRATTGDTKSDTQPKTALYSRYNHSGSTKDKREMECHYA